MGYDLRWISTTVIDVDTIQPVSKIDTAMNFGNIYIKKVNFELIFGTRCRYRINLYVVEY